MRAAIEMDIEASCSFSAELGRLLAGPALLHEDVSELCGLIVGWADEALKAGEQEARKEEARLAARAKAAAETKAARAEGQRA